jgi:hypothetical protein
VFYSLPPQPVLLLCKFLVMRWRKDALEGWLVLEKLAGQRSEDPNYFLLKL